MWQTEYIKDVMEEYVNKRSYNMYLPRIGNIPQGPLSELAAFDPNWNARYTRSWYCPRVTVSKDNCDEIMDLFGLCVLTEDSWAVREMRRMNKHFKQEILKVYYLRRRENFRKKQQEDADTMSEEIGRAHV